MIRDKNTALGPFRALTDPARCAAEPSCRPKSGSKSGDSGGGLARTSGSATQTGITGMLVPTEAEAAWVEPDGQEFVYVRFAVEGLQVE